MRESKINNILNPIDLKAKPISLQNRVFLVFVEIALIGTIIGVIVTSTFNLLANGEALLILALGLQAVALAVYWFLLKRMVFDRLNTIARVAHGRNRFLTGGRRRPTTRHKISSDQDAPIIVMRRQDAPHLPKEAIGADEVGILGAFIENEYLRQRRYEGLVRDLFESCPDPMLAIGESGIIYQANRPVLDLFGMTTEEFFAVKEQSSLADTLRNHLHLPESVCTVITSVLEQTGSRVGFQEFEVPKALGHRDLLLSVSALTYNNQRIAVVLIHNQRLRGQLIPWNLVADFGVQQLDKLDRIHELVYGECVIDAKATGWAEVVVQLGHVRDSINAILEISHAMSSRLSHEVEFDLEKLLRHLLETMDLHAGINLDIESGVSPIVYGSPNYYRSLMTSILTEFKSMNCEEATIRLQRFDETPGIKVTVCSTAVSVRRSRSNQVLCTMAKFFGVQPIPLSRQNKNVFFAFSATPSNSEQSQCRLPSWQRLDELAKKRIGIIQTEAMVDQQTVRTLRGLKCKTGRWFELEQFAKNEVDIQTFDALIFLVGRPRWGDLPHLATAVNNANKQNVPSILVSRTPRRGESEDASKLGFTAYLSYPISRQEMERALNIITNPAILRITQARGILTRHVVRDMTESVGSALVSEFTEADGGPADCLTQTLEQVGFEVVRTRSQSAFFATLFQRRFDYVFCPGRLSSGLQRQIALVLRRRPTVCYFVPQAEQAHDDWSILGPIIMNVTSATEVIDALWLVTRKDKNRNLPKRDQANEPESTDEAS